MSGTEKIHGEAFVIEFRGTEGQGLYWSHCRFGFDLRIVLNWSICVHLCPVLLPESRHLVFDSIASISGFVVLSAEVPGLAS